MKAQSPNHEHNQDTTPQPLEFYFSISQRLTLKNQQTSKKQVWSQKQV